MSQDAARVSTLPWESAWCRANDLFYGSHAAEEHFTTSVTAGNEVARAIADVIAREHARHGNDEFVVIDIGSGSGLLLEQLRARIAPEIHLIGVDRRERPTTLDARITWRRQVIDEDVEEITGQDGQINGLVIAHEFLDDVPCDVVELDDSCQPRVVLVDPSTGAEELGPRLSDSASRRCLEGDPVAVQSWLTAWWPPTRPGARREIGIRRDRVWRRLTRIPRSGAALAIDYAHDRAERAAGLWDAGTLKGFASGRPRRAVPDGSVNITAHVALDALAQPGSRTIKQGQVLEGTTLASFPLGLGSFTWLFQPIG